MFWTPYADWIYVVVSLIGLTFITWMVLRPRQKKRPLRNASDLGDGDLISKGDSTQNQPPLVVFFLIVCISHTINSVFLPMTNPLTVTSVISTAG